MHGYRLGYALAHAQARHHLRTRLALPISHSQRVEVTEGRSEVSTTIAFRIAKLLEVSLHDVLQGLAIAKPTCPHCGKAIS